MNHGCFRRRIAFGAAASVFLFLAACGGHHTTPPLVGGTTMSAAATAPQNGPTLANGAAGNDVAVFGDGPKELAARIAEARQARLHPKFVEVVGKQQMYLFPVYAQVLRSNRALIVRGYGRIYVYPLSGVTVRYSGVPVSIDRLPQVTATLIDHDIAAGKLPGHFNLNRKQKMQLCPDCVELLLYHKDVLQLASAWNGKLDFWQATPDYVPWAPPTPTNTRGVHPMVYDYASSCSTCYSSTGYSPSDNPYAGGGGSTPPSPAPIPSASPGCTNGTTAQQNTDNTAEKQMHDHLSSSISQNQEWAGFIYEDSSGAQVSVGNYYNTDPSTGAAIGWPQSPPPYAGWTPVGWFHDHSTDYANSNDPSGIQGPNQVPLGQPYSGNYFSINDEDYSNSNDINGYVGLQNEYGNQWAEWTAGGNPGTQTNYNDKGGLQSGC